MSEAESKVPAVNPKGKRRHLTAERKYQVFLEAQRGDQAIGELLRREGLYSTDLARIREQVKAGALERLSAKPGRKPGTVPVEEYAALKQELEAKERALADMAVELGILVKKTNGSSWAR